MIPEFFGDYFSHSSAFLALVSCEAPIYKISGNAVGYVHQGTPGPEWQTFVNQGMLNDFISFFRVHRIEYILASMVESIVNVLIYWDK